MAKKTCLRFENARVGTSEAHNRRVRKLDYIREDLSPQNEVWQECTISERLDLIHKTYFEAVHQKYQSSAHPIKEFVLVTDKKTTMNQVKFLCQMMKEEFGFNTFAIFIHKDEGHYDSQNPNLWIPNYHAHFYVDITCYDKEKEVRVACKSHGKNLKDENGHVIYKTVKAYGKLIDINRDMCHRMQDLAAIATGLERGEPSDVKHLGIVEYKVHKEQEKLESLIERESGLTSDIMKEENALHSLRTDYNKLRREHDYLAAEVSRLRSMVNETLKLMNNVYVYIQEWVNDKLQKAREIIKTEGNTPQAQVYRVEAENAMEKLKRALSGEGNIEFPSSAPARFAIIEHDPRLQELSFDELRHLLWGHGVKHAGKDGCLMHLQIRRVYDEYELVVSSITATTSTTANTRDQDRCK